MEKIIVSLILFHFFPIYFYFPASWQSNKLPKKYDPGNVSTVLMVEIKEVNQPTVFTTTTTRIKQLYRLATAPLKVAKKINLKCSHHQLKMVII